MDIERNVEQAARDVDSYFKTGTFVVDPEEPIIRVQAPKASRSDFIGYIRQWKNGRILLGTTLCWFILDMAYYGLGLNSVLVLQDIHFTDTKSAYSLLRGASVGNIVLSLGGLLPGYYAAFLVIDRPKVGRKNLQLFGFSILFVIFCIMGFGYNKLGKAAFVFFYCLANFFQNLGPNTTTFIIPGEIFPTRYRSTAHGISAAAGKLGAIIAQVGFARVKLKGCRQNADITNPTCINLKTLLEIFAFLMLAGAIATYFFIEETNQKTLEDISHEPQENFVSGVVLSEGAEVRGLPSDTNLDYVELRAIRARQEMRHNERVARISNGDGGGKRSRRRRLSNAV